jgi:multidrug transporter EmrE-like cation transporter
MAYLFIVGTVLFTMYGQIIIKWRLTGLAYVPEPFLDKMLFLIKMVFDPYIFSGLLSSFFASLFWMAAMTKMDLSQAYPFVTAGLTVLTVLSGIFVLSEAMTPHKLIGLSLITAGVAVMGFTR